ncbi:protein phosphatase [Streptomyces sp. NPDC057236]|uniref:protein phosphatase n=1 Tax=Streptomyces sp. NPDC057236 TaxID=3346059 RepID=UPI003639A13B
MSADLIDPQNIPQFTGDLEQLGTDHMLLTAEAIAFRQSGSDVHTRFQGLSACYTAPEAEQLFATTAPVAAKADEFADDLEKVAAALSSYETEIQPLVAKLKSLKQRAETFRQQIAGDDDWREDDDNVQLNNDLVYDVNATAEAFWLAEIACHNKITALVGGSTLIIEDGARQRLVKRGTSTYGFTADLLDQSEELPWGRTVEKERHGLDWLGHQLMEFGKGFVVDGVWGTIRGLGTLVGFDGWDAAGEAWKGLGKLATGVLITAVPVVGVAYWAMPEDKLPSYLRDSRNAVKETGKALVAWDQWGENPARAGGAVTFNVLTTVFTGGAGAAAKGGAVARTVGALGKTARLVDPMTYLGKAATFGTVKVADLFAGLRGVHAGAYADILSGTGRVQPDGSVVRVADDMPVIRDNVVEWPDGTRLNLDDGSVVRADGTAAPAKVELSAADRELLERSLPHEEPALVSARNDATAMSDRGGDGPAGTRATHESPAGSVGPTPSEHNSPAFSHQSSGGGNGNVPPGSGHEAPGQGGPGDTGPSDGSAGQAPLPERANEPLPELTPQERADHWNHLERVEGRSPSEFDELQRDPDKNGGISEPSKDEARVGLDLREQGRLPDDIQRPAEADRGEFYSPSADRYYDIKGVHSDWPPFNNVRDKSQPFKGAYDPARNGRWVKKLQEQIVEKQRIVILDVRNANQAAIDDIKSVVRKNGWEDDVIWYP